MEIISTIFNQILYKPLFNLLVILYNAIPGHDFGIAIILITLLIRFVLFPLSKKGIKSRKSMETLQPKIKELQKKYKDDKQEQSRKLMEVYKKNKVNPASGCLPLIVQLPILIALYRAFMGVTDSGNLDLLYSFVKNPGFIDPSFLGIIDLSKANVVLAVLAGIFQFIQSKLMFKSSSPSKSTGGNKMASMQKTMGRQMTYFMPLITIFIALKLPAGLPLYWAVSTLFGIGEYWLVHRDE